jgi:aryl-alcohol dehydrogenase-like predicted oxidoreductase
MKLHRLGSDGPDLSVVGFGAWEAGAGAEWGEAPPDETIVEAIRTVLETPINWIDTAEVYGKGHSEELVGRAVAGHRDEVSIASKVAPAPEGSGFRPEEVARACRESLRRLDTDRIDVYQLHWPDEPGAPLQDTWGAMSALVEEGVVRYIGVSNFDQGMIETCEAIRHVDSLQQEFSMLQLSDRDLIRWCGDRGTGVLAYGPLAYGLLTGAISADTALAPGDFRGHEGGDAWEAMFRPDQRARSLALVDALRPVAERLDCTLAQLALGWTAAQPGVTSAIAGSRNPEHVRSNAAAGDVELDATTVGEIDSLLSLGPADRLIDLGG